MFAINTTGTICILAKSDYIFCRNISLLIKNEYRISSYKTLPWIIPAFLIMPAPGTLLCRWNLVISNNTRSWRPHEKIIAAGLIWGNTVTLIAIRALNFSTNVDFLGQYRVAHKLFKRSRLIQEKMLWFYPIVWRYVHTRKTTSF